MTAPIDDRTDEIRGTYLEDVAETIRENAIAWAREKLAPSQKKLELEALFNNQCNFLEYFKHGLASEIAKTLAANDERVEEVFIFDPSTNPDCETGAVLPVDATIHMIVRVSSPSAALDAFIESMDRAFVNSLKSLPSPVYAHRTFILDVNLVNEKDAQLGLGYASLLSSIFAPALKILEREQ